MSRARQPPPKKNLCSAKQKERGRERLAVGRGESDCLAFLSPGGNPLWRSSRGVKSKREKRKRELSRAICPLRHLAIPRRKPSRPASPLIPLPFSLFFLGGRTVFTRCVSSRNFSRSCAALCGIRKCCKGPFSSGGNVQWGDCCAGKGH